MKTQVQIPKGAPKKFETDPISAGGLAFMCSGLGFIIGDKFFGSPTVGFAIGVFCGVLLFLKVKSGPNTLSSLEILDQYVRDNDLNGKDVRVIKEHDESNRQYDKLSRLYIVEDRKLIFLSYSGSSLKVESADFSEVNEVKVDVEPKELATSNPDWFPKYAAAGSMMEGAEGFIAGALIDAFSYKSIFFELILTFAIGDQTIKFVPVKTNVEALDSRFESKAKKAERDIEKAIHLINYHFQGKINFPQLENRMDRD